MYLYKTKDNQCLISFFNDMSEDDNLVAITQEEWLKFSNDLETQQVINIVDFYKKKLSATDYIAIKFAEGVITEEEYLTTKKQRIEWREEINKLEDK